MSDGTALSVAEPADAFVTGTMTRGQKIGLYALAGFVVGAATAAIVIQHQVAGKSSDGPGFPTKGQLFAVGVPLGGIVGMFVGLAVGKAVVRE